MTQKLTAAEKKKLESLDKRIEKLEDKVAAKKHEYDDLTEQLMRLLDERHPERKEERVKESLYKAFQKGGLSLEEALALLENTDAAEEW